MNDLRKKLSEIAAYSPEGFYSTRDKLTLGVLDRSREAFRRADTLRSAVNTECDFYRYRESARAAILKSLGNIPDRTVESASILGRSLKDGIIIEKLLLKLCRGTYITALLYLPENAIAPMPAVLFQCGHAKDGKAYDAYAAACMTIAAVGIAVFAFDPMGQGERIGYDLPSPSAEHQLTGNIAWMCGESLSAYFLADAMAALDYLVKRPEIDPERIGATGSSGGGTMTALLSAIDDRIKATAPATFLTDRESYIYSAQPQDAEQIWYGATKDGFDHYELVSCFCPKPYMILGVKSDFFCIEGTKRLFDTEKRFYTLLGAEENLKMTLDDSTHAYTPTLAVAAAEFFAETLLGEKRCARYVSPPAIADLTVTTSGSVFGELSDARKTTDLIALSYERASTLTPNVVKDRLTEMIFSNRRPCNPNPRRLSVIEQGDLVCERFLWFTEERIPAYGVLLSGKGAPRGGVTVCLWKDGTDALADHTDKINEILDSGRSVFVPDLIGIGKCAPYSPIKDPTSPFAGRMKNNSDLYFLGDSVPALFSYALIRSLDMLCDVLRFSDLSLYTVGSFGVYADILEKTEKSIRTERSDYKSPKEIVKTKDVGIPEVVNYLLYGSAHLLK